MSSGWEKLTDKQKTGLEKEIRELFEWERAQREQLMRTLKDEGKWIGGLDGNQKEMQERRCLPDSFLFLYIRLYPKIVEVENVLIRTILVKRDVGNRTHTNNFSVSKIYMIDTTSQK